MVQNVVLHEALLHISIGQSGPLVCGTVPTSLKLAWHSDPACRGHRPSVRYFGLWGAGAGFEKGAVVPKLGLSPALGSSPILVVLLDYPGLITAMKALKPNFTAHNKKGNCSFRPLQNLVDTRQRLWLAQVCLTLSLLSFPTRAICCWGPC